MDLGLRPSFQEVRTLEPIVTILSPIMENQMEKKMEHEMETGVV